MKRKSQKAFEHNIKAEMKTGKPQKQALAIAYSIKQRSKAEGGKLKALKRPSTIPFYEGAEKHVTGEGQEFTPGEGIISTHMRKIDRNTGEYEMHGPKKGKMKGMAEGGSISASIEKRPRPNDLHDDSGMEHRNSARHAPMRGDDAKTQDNTSYQAKKGMKTTRIKHPKMVPSDVVQARLRDEEDDLMTMDPIHTEEAYSQGRDVPDEEHQHSNGKRAMLAEGGKSKRAPYNDPMHDDMPSEDEGHAMASSRNEIGPDRQGDEIPDMEEPHSEQDEMYHDNMHDDSTEASDTMGRASSGGMTTDDDEMDMDHAASVAAAIMMKRKKMAMGGYARGGEIIHDSEEPLSHGSMDSDDSSQVDLVRNAEEDANEEDQASFDALRKENYSDSDGLRHMDSLMDSNEHEPEHEEMDEHDRSMVGAIRSKMRKKSAMTR